MYQINYQNLSPQTSGSKGAWLRKIQPMNHFVSVCLSHERELLSHFKHLNFFVHYKEGTRLGESVFDSSEYVPMSESRFSWPELLELSLQFLEYFRKIHQDGFCLLHLSIKHCWLDKEKNIRISNALESRRLDESGRVIYFDQENQTETMFWNQDLYDLGQLLSDLFLQTEPVLKEHQNIQDSLSRLAEQLKNPDANQRGQSVPHITAQLKAWLNDQDSGSFEMPNQVEQYLNRACENRKKHREWCLRKLTTTSMLHFDWNKGWEFQLKWEAFVLPDEVADELIHDFKEHKLVLDELLSVMVCANRGLPFKVLSKLGFSQIMTDPQKELGPWMDKHVLSIEGDKCVWSHPKLCKELQSLISENVFKQKQAKVIDVFKDSSLDDLSVMSQVISLVQEQNSNEINLNHERLWDIHYRALKQYIWLGDWDSAFAAVEWLWLHKKSKPDLNVNELILNRIDCWMALNQWGFAEQQLKTMLNEPLLRRCEILRRLVDLFVNTQREDEARELIMQELELYELPWLSRIGILGKFKPKMTTKSYTRDEKSELLNTISLLRFDPQVWSKQLKEFAQSISLNDVQDLKQNLTVQKFECSYLNFDSEMLMESLEQLSYNEYKLLNPFNEVQSFGFEWLTGAPVEVVLEKVSKWLNVPVRRKVKSKLLAEQLYMVLNHFVYGKPIDKEVTSPSVYSKLVLALKGKWGDLYDLSKIHSHENKLSLESFYERFLSCLATVFVSKGEAKLEQIHQFQKELQFIQPLEPDVSGTIMFLLQILQQKLESNSEIISSEMDLILSLFKKKSWSLMTAVFLKSLEDMSNMGWLRIKAERPDVDQFLADSGYWGLLGQNLGSWVYEKDDPVLQLLRDLSRAENHESRVQTLLSHLMIVAGATHTCCWISWGEDWLPPFKSSSSEAKYKWSVAPSPPDLKGDRIERKLMCDQFMDQFICRIQGRSRTMVIFLANDAYQHCFSIKQFDQVSKMVEYAIESIENELALDWSKKYMSQLIPQGHPAHEITKRTEGLPPLEDLEFRLNKVVEGLQAEKDEMTKKNQAWMQQVHEEMKKQDQLQSLGRLVASLAHEINNPNSFIKLNAPMVIQLWKQYLQPNAQNPLSKEFIEERIPVLLQTIEEGADRIDHLIQDLKNFARQNHDETMHPVNLCEVIDAALRMNKKYIDQHTTSFTANIPSECPEVMGLTYRLEQVVVNLLHNACDALGDPSKAICLSLSSNDHQVILEVSDEGCGMDEETQKAVFEPFFTTKDQSHGMGMGMAVVKNILDQHQARAEIHSKVGEGTTFTLYFPIAAQKN